MVNRSVVCVYDLTTADFEDYSVATIIVEPVNVPFDIVRQLTLSYFSLPPI